MTTPKFAAYTTGSASAEPAEACDPRDFSGDPAALLLAGAVFAASVFLSFSVIGAGAGAAALLIHGLRKAARLKVPKLLS